MRSLMETCSSSSYYPCLQPLAPQSSYLSTKPNFAPKSQSRYVAAAAALEKKPKGFEPKQPKKKTTRKNSIIEEEEEEEDEEEEENDVIPEIVTNRMINRIGVSVGTPLFIGLMFFPFFYYLKTGLKIDVPNWIPVLVSFAFFGTALLGVSYGIVSSSWDPLREGSFLGWNEAQKNWPVFWQSFWAGGGSKKK